MTSSSATREKNEQLSVFDYVDYRKFLCEYYKVQKSRRSTFSFRNFAQKAKLSSDNYLKLVMDGKRRITDKNLPAFIRGLGLKSDEAKYFRLIVLFNEAKDPDEKRDLLSKVSVLRSRKKRSSQTMSPSQESVLKHWATWVIREMVLLKDFKSDSNWISKKINREITPKKAEESLDLLLESGLIECIDRGRFSPTARKLATQDEVVSCLIRDLHAQFIERGLKSLFEDDLPHREFAGLTIALSDEQIPKFKEKIKQFRKDLNNEFSDSSLPLTKVHHFEMMFFPVTDGEIECEN